MNKWRCGRGCSLLLVFTLLFLSGAGEVFGFTPNSVAPSDGEVLGVGPGDGNITWNFTFNINMDSPACTIFWNVSHPDPNMNINWTPMKENISYTIPENKSVSHPAIPNGTYEWNLLCEGPDSPTPEWGNTTNNWTFIIVNSSIPDCRPLDNPTCDSTPDCTWEDYAGFCLLDCFQYDSSGGGNDTTCNGAYGGDTCVWKPDPYGEEGLCNPFFFEMGYDGASPCFEYDGNKSGCTDPSMSDECSWFSEPDCPSGEPCTDVSNGTEHGWCDPQGKFDFSQDFPCWQKDGNKTGCEALKSEFLKPCEWFPDPWAPDYTGNGTGWCDMAFYGGAGGCWDFPDETSCGNAGDIGCKWENDSFNPNDGFCREQGCWDFDNFNASITINQSEACSNFSASISFSNCTWEGATPGNETIGFCYEDWQDFDCSQNNNNSKGCFDTFYCVWKDDGVTKECIDPMSGGPGFPGPIGPNPGCFILPQEKCLEITNSTGELCEWNATTTNCEVNSTNPLDPAQGIQCGDINNSAFCSNIPFLSSCCKWNATYSNNTCVEASYSTECWDNMQPPPPGQAFCEDWNVTTSSDCDKLSGDPWYMPCKWDLGECRFAFDDMFGGGPMFDKGFDDIFSKGSCENAGGVWKQEKWSDPATDQIFIDEWCEMGMGKGYDTCNTTCWACEYQDNGSNWENATAMEDACGAAYGPGGAGCIFINETNAMNGIGWCDVNSTFDVFIDFEFEDCFSPWEDSDGDGLLPDKDPDCSEFNKWGGFIKPEIGFECNDGIDNDGNNQTDCDDPSCAYDPFFCSGNVSEDLDPPEVKLLTKDTYLDGAFFDIVTNEPTNATILFYYQSPLCNVTNETAVTDPKLNNSLNETWQEFDDYDIWHGIPVDDVSLTALGNATLQPNTAYYYKTLVFDKNGNNATSACNNFTTIANESNFTVGFKLPPPGNNSNDILGFLGVQFDWDGDGVFEENQSTDAQKKRVNKSKGKKVNIKFTNPNATNQWEIHLIGANFKDKDGSRVLNITDAFIVNDTGGDIRIGMKKSRWSEIAQKLGVDLVKVIIPKGSSGLTNVKINHCPDDATTITGSNCTSVYTESDKTKANCTISVSNTTCEIPTNIGFSVFGVTGTAGGGSPGGGGGEQELEQVIVEVNATLENGTAEATITSANENDTVKVTVPSADDVYFTGLSIVLKAEISNTKLTITMLDEKPSNITSDVSGIVHSYIQIDEENLEATDIRNVTISFKVPVTWINENNINKSTVTLSRYSDGSWTELTTTKGSEDSEFVRYSAVSTGLSVFGISGQVQKPETPATVPTTTVPTTTQPSTTATTEPPKGDDGLPVKKIIIAAIVIIVIIAAGAYLYQKKGAGEREPEAPEEVQEPAAEESEEEPKE